MKIGQVAEGWAVLGTRVSDFMVSELMKIGRCNVWLDPDAAGRRGAGKIVKQLRAYGLEIRDIQSIKDPKLHTRSEIKEYIS
jgi:DNA primase